MKKIILNITKMIVSLITIPLWFIPFFHDRAVLPNSKTNELVEVIFKHTMFENMDALDLSFLFYVSIVVVIGSVVLSMISIKTTNKRMHIISNIVFTVTIVLFLLCLGLAATVQRVY